MTEQAKVAISRDGDAITVVGSGSLDLYSADEFGAALKEATGSAKSVVVDFTPAYYIDTAILNCLVVAARQLLPAKGRLKVLVAEGGHPQYVLKTVRFDTIMDLVVGDTRHDD